MLNLDYLNNINVYFTSKRYYVIIQISLGCLPTVLGSLVVVISSFIHDVRITSTFCPFSLVSKTNLEIMLLKKCYLIPSIFHIPFRIYHFTSTTNGACFLVRAKTYPL